jgi:GTP-binding protein
MFKIAIIGRPNVGKSTLFNKLIGKNFSLTDNIPGVTRDRKEAMAKLGPLEFVAIDTAGLENEITDKSLEKRMMAQTEAAVADADLCLFVVDGKEGVTNKDFFFAQWLKKLNKKTVLVANKCENLNEEIFGNEYYKLGFGKPTAISSEHKLGFGDLYEKIAPEIAEYEKNFSALESASEDEKSALQIAIIGRPNAGKSTFLNNILGQERVITGPEAGITRDAIAIDYQILGQKIRFIDTAGIRKKSNITQKLEKLSSLDSFRAIRFAQIVILLIDCNSLLDHQDMALAGEILREGRGLVFAINKIDSVSGDKEIFLREVRKQIQSLLPEIEGAAIVGVSAKTGYNVQKTLEFALATYQQWQSYIPTNQLVDWLKSAEAKHPPKLFKGKAIKLKYATQIKKRPPTFAVFTNHIKPLEGAYQRYLVNSLREYFNLKLTPIRLLLRKSENPFATKKEKNFSKKLHVKK